MLRVPWHRASSEDVAWGELPCSFLLEVSELVPEQPTTMRRKAHPTRKVPTTTAMRCPCRTTAPLPSLHLAGAHKSYHHQQRRRYRQPRQPDHRARRNDPRGVVEVVAAVVRLLAVAEQREVFIRLRKVRGAAACINLEVLLTVGID